MYIYIYIYIYIYKHIYMFIYRDVPWYAAATCKDEQSEQ